MLKILRSVFKIDLRSLALFRIVLGTIMICDLCARAPQLKDFYTDDGVLPSFALTQHFMEPWNFSLFLVNNTTVWASLLFLFAIIVNLFLILGYRTRLASVLSWIMLISLQNRNSFVLYGVDMLLRCLSFWKVKA